MCALRSMISAALLSTPREAVCARAKAAPVGFTKALAAKVAQQGVTVILAPPATVDTLGARDPHAGADRAAREAGSDRLSRPAPRRRPGPGVERQRCPRAHRVTYRREVEI